MFTPSIHLTIDIVDTVGVIETWPYDDVEAYILVIPAFGTARAEILDPLTNPDMQFMLAVVGPDEYN